MEAHNPKKRSPAPWILGIGALLAILSAIAGLRSGAPLATGLEGTAAPEFLLPRLDSAAAQPKSGPAQSRGKPLLLHFWSPSCEPCVAELPTWQALAAQGRAPGGDFTVLTVTAEEPADVRNFLTQRKIQLPTVLDADAAVHEAYHVAGIPHTVAISKTGVIVRELVRAHSAQELEQALDAARNAP